MKKSIRSELSKYLKSLDREDLEKEVKTLYTKFKEVKQYYEMELSGDTSRILTEYKERITKEYFPKRGFGQARSGVSRKVINDFKKVSIIKKDVIELILHRVEMMISYTDAYGDMNESFYNTLVRSFDEACQLVQQERLEDIFKEDCIRLMDAASSFGWGVYDGMHYTYEAYFE